MENDTDAAFVGEAGIDAQKARTGERNAVIARGGVGTDWDDAAFEQDPLLAQQRGRRPSDADSGHEWLGGSDFDHLPWYRKPSV